MQTIRRVLTILNGTAVSDEIVDARTLAFASALTIVAPAALTNVVKAEVGDVAAGQFGTLQSPAGTDVAFAAGKAVILPAMGMGDLRLKSAANEGADRVFVVLIQVWK